MGKALLVNSITGPLTTGDDFSMFGADNASSEGLMQVLALADLTLTNLRAHIVSGGDGTNNFRMRVSGADGNLLATRAGPGTAEDLVNSDTVLAAQNFNVGYTDTGTDSVVEWCSVNMELASGHGCLYVTTANANIVHDVASSTRFLCLGGFMATDGNATLSNCQWMVGAAYTMTAWQVRAQTNARLNDSTFRVNVNGTQVGTAITFATTETGTKSATGMSVAIAKDDLVAYDITLGAGVEDLNLNFVGSLLTSAEGKSECFAAANGGGTNRTASATPTYYRIGGQQTQTTLEADARIRPGFDAKVEYPRLNVTANTYSTNASFEILKNGVSAINLTITAGATGWISDDALFTNINDTDELSISITGGGTGSITFRSHGFTFAPLDVVPDDPAHIMSGGVMAETIMSGGVMSGGVME